MKQKVSVTYEAVLQSFPALDLHFNFPQNLSCLDLYHTRLCSRTKFPGFLAFLDLPLKFCSKFILLGSQGKLVSWQEWKCPSANTAVQLLSSLCATAEHIKLSVHNGQCNGRESLRSRFRCNLKDSDE